jgi:hypothetical protein
MGRESWRGEWAVGLGVRGRVGVVEAGSTVGTKRLCAKHVGDGWEPIVSLYGRNVVDMRGLGKI